MKKSFWKPSRITIVVVTAVTLLASYTPALHQFEDQLPYWTSRFIPESQQVQDLTVVNIDEASLQAYGPWPWTRDRLADVVERLAQFEPRIIGYMVPLAEPETTPELDEIRKELDALDKDLRGKASRWLNRAAR